MEATLLAPAFEYVAVTPSDTVPIPNCRALYVGTGGNLTIKAPGSANPVLFANMPSGAILDANASYVMATGTSASNIVALY